MWIVKGTTVTQHTCYALLSLLDSIGYDTEWIRFIWNLNGISNLWCAKRCLEIINTNGIIIPNYMNIPELFFVVDGE